VQFAISNIAWLPEEDETAYNLLSELGVGHLEVAPGRIWPDPGAPEAGVLPASVDRRSLTISGFQAILFGKPELLLFDDVMRPKLAEHLIKLAQTCSTAGGKYLVFGAPKNRLIPPWMSTAQAFDVAGAFFQVLAARTGKLGVTFGIEANPTEYGCNFCTHVADVARLVREVDSSVIRWHLDTGEMAMNSEKLPDVILDHADLIGSVHVSEPDLGDFSNPWPGHLAAASALRSVGYNGILSLEMKRPSDGLAGVRRAAEFLLSTYQ